MHVRRTIEINDEAGIPPYKSYQSLETAAGGHDKLNFIEKDVRNFITREFGLPFLRILQSLIFYLNNTQVLASLHGRDATERNHHRSMSIDAESHRKTHANNNPQ
ncbi:hypothetical protein PIB30_109560, partial [Stylosanthes scabra]|nr:hypothetical protein [Stylosanthes scabra]